MLNPLRRLLTAVTLLLVPTLASAQEAAPLRDVDPALWVVKDRDTTIYLFGTVHVLKPGLRWFDDGVKKAFDRSQEVVLETVQPDQASMQGLVMKLGIDADGPPLPQKLPAEDRKAYLAAITSLGLPANAFDQLDPWFAATNLQLMPLGKLGYNPNSGVEAIITAAAQSAHKPISGLETPEQQLGYLDGLSETAQISMLNQTVKDLPKIGETIDTMVDAWGKADLKTLEDKINDSLRESPEVAKVLLADRNARWAQWIKARLAKSGVVFIAVGAGHLAGKDSVQEQLARLKLKAKRVRY